MLEREREREKEDRNRRRRIGESVHTSQGSIHIKG